MNNKIKDNDKEIKRDWELAYDKVNAEIKTSWPKWKKEAYNEMFAVSTHAIKL